MGVWSRLNAFLIGGAVARASSDAVTPVLEPVRQHAWTKNQLRVLDPNMLAELVAQGGAELAAAEGESSRSGYNPNRLAAMIYLRQTVPGVAEALTLYRRNEIDLDQLEHAYAKHAIDPAYWPGLTALAQALLSSAEVANAVQQGHVPNPGVLPDPGASTPPPKGFKQAEAVDGDAPTTVPLTQIDLDPIAEAAGSGIDLDRLRVEANLAGLPPGAETLLSMWNRGYITEEALDSGIREGHMKTKWLQAFKRMRWWIPSPQEIAAARLRTWLTKDEANELGALHGVSPDLMELLFLNRGRPASPTQMWTAHARKIIGPRGVPTEYEDHAKAIAISDIRPEYAEMLWGIRFAYPSLFQLSRLVQSSAIDPDTAALWASYNRYGPDVIAPLTVYWRTLHGGASKEATKTEIGDEFEGGYITEAEFRAALTNLGYTGNAQEVEVELGNARRLKKWRESTVDAIAKAYLAHAIDDAAALSELGEANVTGDAAQMLLRWWAMERRVTVRELTDAQLVKAFGHGIITEAVALGRLQELGLSAADAQIRLQEG